MKRHCSEKIIHRWLNMMVQGGLNKIRDLHYAAVTAGWMGTSGSALAESQTNLQSGVKVTVSAITKSQADKSNSISYTLMSSAGTARTYREFGSVLVVGTTATTTVYDRNIFTGIYHSSNDEVIVTKSYYYRGS